MTGSNSFSDIFLQAAKWDIYAYIHTETIAELDIKPRNTFLFKPYFKH